MIHVRAEAAKNINSAAEDNIADRALRFLHSGKI